MMCFDWQYGSSWRMPRLKIGRLCIFKNHTLPVSQLVRSNECTGEVESFSECASVPCIAHSIESSNSRDGIGPRTTMNVESEERFQCSFPVLNVIPSLKILRSALQIARCVGVSSFISALTLRWCDSREKCADKNVRLPSEQNCVIPVSDAQISLVSTESIKVHLCVTVVVQMRCESGLKNRCGTIL